MADHTIVIQVDPHTRVFQYTDENTQDASSILLTNGDRLVWALDPSLSTRTFQIDFGPLNPFQFGQALSLRGIDFVVSAVVRVPVTYTGNRGFKYSVSLGNGWQDDPHAVVVPEPPDPPNAFQGANQPLGNIAWDATETNINIVPTVTLAAKSSGILPRATVSWQWAPGQVDTQAFTLQFKTAVAGWPSTTTILQSNPQTITLSLPPGGPANFTVTTNTPDQTGAPFVNGTLTVT